MLLLRDSEIRARVADLSARHLATIADAQAGRLDLRAVQAGKLIQTLAAAAHAPLYVDALPQWRDPNAVAHARDLSADALLTEVCATTPLLERAQFQARSRAVFTRPTGEFLHYYESSGTTGDPVAAPKAIDDLVVNTMNIGEMWRRLIDPRDVVLNLINGPFAPAGYQFEKVLEYLGVLSMRLWVDNVTGDYARVLRMVRQVSANVYLGTASRLLQMLEFGRRSGEPAPSFDRLLLMAEQTGPAFLRHLERITGATAHVATYGSSETGTTAVTCERGQLHLQLHSYMMELHDERGTRLIDGTADSGELVVTTLDLPARPLIRYRTGDRVRVTGTPCPCGIALPVVTVLGRQSDELRQSGREPLRQEDIETRLWPTDPTGPAVLDYMLVLRRPQVVCLVTTDQPPDAGWIDAATRRVGALFTGYRFALRPVDRLPDLAAMGPYVGWKMSRLLDLDDPRQWRRLPNPIDAVVRQALETVEATTGLESEGSPDTMTDSEELTDAQRAEFVLGVYFRTQAAIEKYVGREGLSQWTEHVAAINANSMRKRLPRRDDQARDLLTGLERMLAVYGSKTTRTEEPDRSLLEVHQCGIYDYRERAQQQGVELTLDRPCEFCVPLHHLQADQLGLRVENTLGERSCRWVCHVPADTEGQ